MPIYPLTGSWDIVRTRKCHADADADAATDANSDTNGIRTKNNMALSPSVGDIISATIAPHFPAGLKGTCLTDGRLDMICWLS